MVLIYLFSFGKIQRDEYNFDEKFQILKIVIK